MRCYRCGGYRRNADEDIRRIERALDVGDKQAASKLVLALHRAGRDGDISYALWRQHESNLLSQQAYTTKNSQKNVDAVLDVLKQRNDISSLYVESIYDWESLVSPPNILAEPERRDYMLELVVWIEAGWRPPNNRFPRQHLHTTINSYDEVVMLLSQQLRIHMGRGKYHYSSHLGRFGELVYVAAHEYMSNHGIDMPIQQIFPRAMRDYIAEYLLWQCETVMANREFNWQALALPMRGAFSADEVDALLEAQHSLGRDLTAKETHRYKLRRELPDQ
jgi:hypothetical protein